MEENKKEIVNETIAEPASVDITPKMTEPIKRKKKDIIGYNPETGEPIYKPIEPGKEPKKKSKKGLIISLIVIILVAICTVGAILLLNNNGDKKSEKKEDKKEPAVEPKPEKEDVVLGDYKLLSSISDYDLYFLQLENAEKNVVYSPLSIKYALVMLNEGTAGDSHKEIASVVGDYTPKKYTNSSNMSFANALFINDDYKKSIEQDYINTLKSKYNAEVILDDFTSTSTINNWVKDKTLKLIDNLLDSLDPNEAFVLVNALGIDMEWQKPFHIKEGYDDWYVKYPHQKFFPEMVSNINMGYPSMNFNDDNSKYYNAVSFVGIVNNYDIIADIGEDKIRSTVSTEYKKWLDADECGNAASEPDVDTYVDKYIDEIGSKYGDVDVSTDFKIYNDDNVKAFSKELKEYNGTTLEFVAIMPKKDSLKDYVAKVKASDLSKIVGSLKEINNDNFAADKITYIHGKLPIFDYEYQLDLISDLNKLGITSVFSLDTADLSKISTMDKLYISDATHKANISLSNDGIKAAAATAIGGKGAASCEFEYFYEPPVEEIDMTFDKPYLYMIIDKDSQEVWFVGTVYNPVEWTNNY